MPQVQLPIFPPGVTPITSEIAFQCEEGKVCYFNGHPTCPFLGSLKSTGVWYPDRCYGHPLGGLPRSKVPSKVNVRETQV